MGRQTPLVATPEDEQLFLAFLRETADISIFQRTGPSIESLNVHAFSSEWAQHGQYFIWNRGFPWDPEYRRVDHPKADPASKGNPYISNLGEAPVLEYDRALFQPRRSGRIYWSKYFSAPDGLPYDVDAFSAWYDKVVRWVRRTGAKSRFGSSDAYLLPDAFRQYGAHVPQN